MNLEAVFKKFKKQAVSGEDSTDDEKILAQAKEIYKKNKKQIHSRSKRLNEKKMLKTRNILEATMKFVHDNDISANFEDPDDDRMEFEDAEDEEFEDKCLKKKKKKGAKLTAREIRKLAKQNDVSEDNMQLSTLARVMDNDDFERILT